MKSKKYIKVLLIFVFISLFLKIDYRFIEEVACCGDDHDYYMHAETIALDRDLDYENQFEGIEKVRFLFNEKKAPKGFIGSGLLAAPFLFLGDSFDQILKLSLGEEYKPIFNFKILFYSFSAIFYLFLSIYFTSKTLSILNYRHNFYHLLLFYFGSGVTYYAFERYSMSHIYEIFSVSFILYLSAKYYLDSDKKIYPILIPIFILVAILVRWVNYFALFLPIIIKIFSDKEDSKKIIFEKYFLLSTGVSFLIFCYLSVGVYGVLTFDPQFVYQNTSEVSSFLGELQNPTSFIAEKLMFFMYILFSQEFGIFWFSPIIFAGLIISFKNLFTNMSKLSFIVPLMYLQVFAIVVIWNSTASSYGFRYLFSLVPLSIILMYQYHQKNTILFRYAIYFSLFAAMSLLFFETTELTSLRENVNVFGSLERFSQPQYLTGYIKSFINFQGYLKIFTTSFLGASIFKIIILVTGIQNLNETLLRYNLPVANQDFQNYLIDLQQVQLSSFVVSNIFISLIVIFIVRSEKKQEVIS